MPAKKKSSDLIQNTVITPANIKAPKGKVQVIEVDNDEDTRVVTTASSKTVKGKPTKANESAPVVKVAPGATKATPNKQTQGKQQAQAVKVPKTPKRKLPKPVTITRFELAQQVSKAVSQHMEITGVEADAIVSEIIETMIDALKIGDEIEIRGFGSFRVRQRNARTGRNPKTGAMVKVPGKSVVYFKMGKDLKEILLADEESSNVATPNSQMVLPNAKANKATKQTKSGK